MQILNKKIERKVIIEPLNTDVETHAVFMNLPLSKTLQGYSNITINQSSDEEKVLEESKRNSKIIISFSNDKIIPLENILAKVGSSCELFTKVKSFEDAKICFETLETGIQGVILETNSIEEINKAVDYLKVHEVYELLEAEVTVIKNLGLGVRVCVDSVDIMNEGEGLLVGTSANGMFLIQAEVAHNDYVASRPFRVNAGAVSLYTLISNKKTRYLQELSAGDEIVIVDRDGHSRISYVGRSKIEKRPLVLIEAKVQDQTAKCLLQLAETIRLVQKAGSVAVNDLKVGDKVLVKIDKGGRHFGMKVENEYIIEK